MLDPTAPDAIRAAAATDRLLRADELGVPAPVMARLTEEGVLERLAPGIYLGAQHARHPLGEAAAWSLRHPTAVVGILTAAHWHGLTDAFEGGTWLLVPKGGSVPRSRHQPLQIIQVQPETVDPCADVAQGVEVVRVHGVPLRVTGPDRTVVDLWKYPHRVTREHALVALRRRVDAPRFDLPAFARLAKRLGAWDTLEPTLQGMVVR